jgi:membrane fusion protein, multidrug efflux system
MANGIQVKTVAAKSSPGSRAALVSIAGAMLLAACSGGGDAPKKGRGPGDMGPPTVGYVVVTTTDVANMTELAGRTSAFESSDVRPQVNGIIRRRYFTEGALVRRGQPLYQIDPRPYQAQFNQARANLASAQANAEATRVQAERYKPLAEIEAVSKQEYTNAVAQARQAQASVGQNRAALDNARVTLGFTTVPAPITGRIGRALYTVGALVSASQADPLAQIQRLDPMFVDIQQSSADILALRRSLAKGGTVPAAAKVRLTLEDGSDYGYTGTLEVSEALVDQQTGTVTVRARFPNPEGLLLPGMFVRAHLVQSINQRAILVPQPAVSRDAKGNATVTVVGPGDKAVIKTVKAERTQGEFWVVTDGLNPGDKVITQGLSKLQPGQPVKPVPADTPEKIVPPQQGGGGQGKGRAG